MVYRKGSLHYSKDGVISKLFEIVIPDNKPVVVEFGDHRVYESQYMKDFF